MSFERLGGIADRTVSLTFDGDVAIRARLGKAPDLSAIKLDLYTRSTDAAGPTP